MTLLNILQKITDVNNDIPLVFGVLKHIVLYI